MKLQIEAGVLLKSLNIVNRVRSGRNVLPILNCVLMTAESGTLVLSRTNLTLAIITRTSLDGDSKGSVAAPSPPITRLLSLLPADETINVETTENQITITGKSGQYSFATMPVEEFPKIRGHKRDGEFVVNPRLFAKDVNGCAFCVGDDPSRPALNGAYWRLSDKSYMAATTGDKLAWRWQEDIRMSGSMEAIIPPPTLLTVADIAKDEDELFVSFDDRRISFRTGETEISSTLIEGPYPQIKQVIPNNNDKTIIVDKQLLIDALNRLLISTDDLHYRVNLESSQTQMTLSASKAASGSHGTETIQCELTGYPIEISFNMVYLIDIIKHIETQKVQIEMSDSVSAAIFRPVNVSDYFYLMMPLRLEK
jgi:DNA polymerase-3 subunit beta